MEIGEKAPGLPRTFPFRWANSMIFFRSLDERDMYLLCCACLQPVHIWSGKAPTKEFGPNMATAIIAIIALKIPSVDPSFAWTPLPGPLKEKMIWYTNGNDTKMIAPTCPFKKKMLSNWKTWRKKINVKKLCYSLSCFVIAKLNFYFKTKSNSCDTPSFNDTLHTVYRAKIPGKHPIHVWHPPWSSKIVWLFQVWYTGPPSLSLCSPGTNAPGKCMQLKTRNHTHTIPTGGKVTVRGGQEKFLRPNISVPSTTAQKFLTKTPCLIPGRLKPWWLRNFLCQKFLLDHPGISRGDPFVYEVLYNISSITMGKIRFTSYTGPFQPTIWQPML